MVDSHIVLNLHLRRGMRGGVSIIDAPIKTKGKFFTRKNIIMKHRGHLYKSKKKNDIFLNNPIGCTCLKRRPVKNKKSSGCWID